MKQQKKRTIRRTKVLPSAALVLTALVIFTAIKNINSAQIIGENAAVFSVVLTMPGPGLAVLEERFRAEIYKENTVADIYEKPQANIWPPAKIEDKPENNIPPDNTQPKESVPSSGSGEEIEMPEIPAKYAAPIISENFAGRDSPAFVKYGEGYIRNDTNLQNSEVEDILTGDFPIVFEDTDEPQVLIVHTHTTESYEKYDRDVYDTRNTWRSTDNSINMAAVGNAMEKVLTKNGIGVIHDTTQHDYPSYNGSYERSAETIKAYLKKYPTIKVVLDLHRDAMQRDNAIVKPVAEINGKKAAQLMIIAACDNGSMGVPEWRENLRFAAAYQSYMESMYPQMTKPVFFCYRKYNMDITTGSLLLEFGSNANTLEEAVYSAQLAGQALSTLIKSNMSDYDDPALKKN